MNCKKINKHLSRLLLLGSLLIGIVPLSAQVKKNFTIDADRPTGMVSPTMWGVFFEDINLGADGGIYAELVKNRSFEFAQPLMGWKKIGESPEGALLVLNRPDHPQNPRFLRAQMNAGAARMGIQNEGFRGMGIKQGLRYDFSVLYRTVNLGIRLHVALVDSLGNTLGEADLNPAPSSDWNKQQISFRSGKTDPKAQLAIWFEGKGTIDLDMISLFPEDTWKHRPGGLRADMVQWLADMKPGFIRFPGGCIVEGRELATRFQWKKTVGPMEDRQLIVNRWNTEFAHRPTPDYYQSFGLGFFEYFQLAEDIGAEPLPILNCGMACQFNTAELVPLEELDEYVQDALDLVEFANGDVSSEWGKLRTAMGHPEPFHLKMIGIGNENWGPQYVERLQRFQRTLKARYPEIKIVASSGTDPNGERFDFLNQRLRSLGVDIIDEHYYRDPDWFLQHSTRYDDYDRDGPKIFAGEYAAQTDRIASVKNRNNWKGAIAEAAFMTGLERNADVIAMASYAPLFAHVEGWQWTPDLIWVDNLRSFGTPNYYVQKLFSTHKGTAIIPILSDDKALSGQDSLYASAVLDEPAGELIVKVVNHRNEAVEGNFLIQTKRKLLKQGVGEILTASLDAQNSLDQPLEVCPQQVDLKVGGKQFTVSLPPYSFQVFRIKLGK